MVEEQTEKIQIPSEFLDENGDVKVNELVSAYQELLAKISHENDQKKVVPPNADAYQLTMKNELIQPDAEINQILFEHGFTNEQAQVVYDLAADKVLPIIENMVDDIAADQELQGLEQAFGGPEQFNKLARQISEWGEKNLDESTFNALAKTKNGILTLYQMMQGKVESPLIQGKGQFAPLDDEKTLRQLMQDPKYWRDQDPELVQRVEAGFKRLYD
ncbi:MAG: hypothetical protein II942_04095 [Alphaproteobacteria bacterium]|nr:hypothetical protein [Alphaproteobacteria bacterium]